jgi:SAM-dependent methyltransferase
MSTEEIENEESIHGRSWDAFHGGYFSDPRIAGPLVRRILDTAAASKPRVLVDLGGGTGYMLSQLLAAGIGSDVALVNLDDSDAQIAVARSDGFTCVHGSVDAFRRAELGPENECFLFTMRSVLHYFGQDGLRRTLRHVRAQARPGEFFVHQTASFLDPRDAEGLNSLYRMMGTQKWYPTVEVLRQCLADEGWNVVEVAPNEPLILTSADLAQRYGLDPSDLSLIDRRLARDYSDRHAAFVHGTNGFRAFLHYWIYVCSASDASTSQTAKGNRYG